MRDSAMNANAMIYKILRLVEWRAFEAAGRFEGSPDDLRDGFIHFSSEEQVAGTLAKYFSGEREVMILSVDPGPLGDALRWEASRNGALFPHLYGVLSMKDVVAVTRVQPKEG